MDWLLLLVGLTGLFLGGEALVRGAVAFARRLAIPPLLIGLTVVGFGTSTPELLVSVDAALRGAPDIALGNVIGSNIGNILLIVGLTALVWPIRAAGGTLARDATVMMIAAVALVPLFWMGEVGRPAGAALVLGLVIYLVLAYRQARNTAHDEDLAPAQPLWQSALWLGAGLLALMLGARFLIDGAVSIARTLGLSEAFIGLTIVAVGTSLPELATSLVAALRRQSAIAIGNIVGSNIFNVLGILGATALIAPIPVGARFLTLDLPVMIAASALLMALLLARPQIGRGTGAALLLAYAAYVFVAQG
ncbi:calcium/sodium antiporter [Plastorhodobacter daqingensis]|uniref:Calcium/sodium antiporter n=1 Tax=Plastorhodobacter daqingensis TaxID=1387281 RepID=A0ABW2UJH0_9RHOB